MLDLPAIF